MSAKCDVNSAALRFFGAYAAASAAHEHRFGFIGHSSTSLIGGA
jgi:hypothetical protein